MDCIQQGEALLCKQTEVIPIVKGEGGEEPSELTSGQTAIYASLSIFLVLMGGLMSGLTVGLASINRLSLEIDAKSDEKVAASAKKIFNVIDRFHWMLVTLLFCNAGAMEALPLALDKLVPGWLAILCSVTGVLFFGEIIPQALCTGPNQIKIAEYMCPIVLFLMYLTIPVSWPIGKLLDYMMGEHKIERYDNDELKQLIMLHTKKALDEVDSDHLSDGVSGLDYDEFNIMQGALQFNEVSTTAVMTDMTDVVTYKLNQQLNKELLEEIKVLGYSRVPISQDDDQKTAIGIFLTKSLVGYTACGETILDAIRKEKIMVRPPVFFTPVTKLNAVASTFKEGSCHMGIVCDERQTAIYLSDQSDRILSSIMDGTYEYVQLDDHELKGVLTLENVIEFILKMEIKDEKDKDKEILAESLKKGNPKLAKKQSKQTTAKLLTRQKSIHYEDESDQEGAKPTTKD
jgi:CBS domain containing-hemolysin-like protein